MKSALEFFKTGCNSRQVYAAEAIPGFFQAYAAESF